MITTRHLCYEKALLKWIKTRDCLEGEDRIHEKGEAYLPKLSASQSEGSYNAFKSRARFWNAGQRTLAGWTGSVNRRPPMVALPDALTPLLADINLQATPFNDFAGQVLGEVLSSGRAGVLVDHQESKAGRSYMLLFKAEEIVNWATVVVDGAQKLALVVLGYCVNELCADGYGTEEVTEYRELRLVDGVYVQRIWREVGDGKERTWAHREVTPMVRGQVLTEIPFVFIGPKSLSPEIQASPLYEIITLNLHHYVESADLRHGLHFVALPTFYTINEKVEEGAGPITVGPGVFQNFQGDNCQVGVLEIGGQGLGLVRQDMQDMKDEIAALGAAALIAPLRMAESAQALENKQNEASAPLVKVVDVVSDGLTEALQWLVYWEGGDETTAVVALNKAFANTRLSAQDIQALSAALQAGSITPEHYAFLLEQAESLPPDLDYKAYAEQLIQQKEERRANTPNNTNPAPPANPLPA